MQWRKHVRIKYGGRVGVGQGQREREQGQLQVRVVQLQREGGARLSYVCHQPQLSSTARRSCSAAAMLCCGRRKVSAAERTTDTRKRTADKRVPVTIRRRWHPSGTPRGFRNGISLRARESLQGNLFARASSRKNRAFEYHRPLTGVTEIFQVDSAKIS